MREAYPPAAAQHLSQPAPHPSLSQSTLHQTSGERERKKERGKGERSEGEHTTTCTTRVSSPSANADAAPAGLSPINSSLSTSTAASNTTCKSRATSGKWEGERAEGEPLNRLPQRVFSCWRCSCLPSATCPASPSYWALPAAGSVGQAYLLAHLSRGHLVNAMIFMTGRCLRHNLPLRRQTSSSSHSTPSVLSCTGKAMTQAENVYSEVRVVHAVYD